jgi:O-antigen ligase
MSVFLLIIINSATSSGTFLVGIILFVGLGRSVFREKIEYIGTILIISMIVGLIIEYSFDIVSMFVTSQGRDMTLSSRTFLWKDLLAFRTNPVIGVGYGSFWLGDRMTRLWELHPFMPNESHNGYLNIYLELGCIGLFLLVGVIYSAYRNIKIELKTNFDYGRLRMGMFFIAILYNVTEDAIGKLTLLWFVFLLVSLDIPRKSSPRKHPQERKELDYVMQGLDVSG